ncbi:MAG: serine/threonine-protein kinase [Verrucomicrobiota bacterium]
MVHMRARMGQYQITGVLGEGGMSQVFKATDVTLGREVALKVLHQALSQDSALTSMFEREAKLTASILHPNVVKVFTVGREEGYFFIAMEIIEAISLEQMIHNKGAIAEQNVLNIAHDVVSGLKAAYHEGLIHRDIKPGNMLVTDEGTAKLVDFGLAVQQGGDDETEDLWATPFYVPPEKLEGEIDTYLGDIYSLGATLYHALAGVPPFEANTSSLEELKEIKKAEVDLKSVAPSVSKPTLRLIDKMMAYAPGSRSQSYDELLGEIEEIESKRYGQSRNERSSLSSGSNRNLILGIVSALSALALGIWYFSRDNDAGSEAGGLNLNTGDNVISGESSNAAAKFVEARGLLGEGKYGEAASIFEELKSVTTLSPSTRMWNAFLNGTVKLLQAKEEESRLSFVEVLSIRGEEPGSEAVIKFLEKASAVLGEPLPVMNGKNIFERDSEQAIGLLAAALKNWQLGEFESAGELFAAFAAADVPENLSWIGSLKPLVAPYERDLARWRDLPNPKRADSEEERNQAKETLAESRSEIETRGALPGLISLRLRRIEAIDLLEMEPVEPAVEPTPPQMTETDASLPTRVDAGPVDPFSDEQLSEEAKAEKRTLIELLGTLQEYGETFLFSEAVMKLQQVPLETWEMQEIRQDLVYGFSRADEFVPMLAEKLSSGSYEGIVRRRVGVPLEATVTSADAEAFTIDLGFGPNEVVVTRFANDWLIEAAEEVLPALAPENQPAWEKLVFFALATNQVQIANRLAVPLEEQFPDFKERWQRLMSFSKGDS